jgi:hypothetical protein
MIATKLLVAAALLGAACSKTEQPALQAVAEEVASEYGVPASLLLAVVFIESRLSALPDLGVPPGWVKLTPGRKDPKRAAKLLDLDIDELTRSRRSNLRAAAALLADAATKAGLPANAPVKMWGPALELFQGGKDPFASALYVHQVMAVHAKGFRGTDDGGNPVELAASRDELPPDPFAKTPARPEDVVGASFVPFLPAIDTSHRPLAPTPRTVKYIVIHVTQNSFPIIVDFFRRAGTNVASHYVVRAHDGFAIQTVDERLVAFHDACFNEESIGIEHEGYVHEGNRWFSDEMYRASARLVRDIATRHGIPLDRAHILGHVEAPDCSDHTDPGAQWDWDKFMRFVKQP